MSTVLKKQQTGDTGTPERSTFAESGTGGAWAIAPCNGSEAKTVPLQGTERKLKSNSPLPELFQKRMQKTQNPLTFLL